MKGNLMSKLVEMDNNEMQQLVAEVKETIAQDVDLTKKSSFNLVDLWRIEKRRKSASKRFADRSNSIPFVS
jgi:hypothetical protein